MNITNVEPNIREVRRIQQYLLLKDELHLEVITKPRETDSEFRVPHLLRQFSNDILYDYQRILENILSLSQKDGIQIIGLTAAHSREGTSTISAVLSALAAVRQNGHSYRHAQGAEKSAPPHHKINSNRRDILLIDTQLKKPSLHTFFGVEPQPGLNEFLDSQVRLNDSLRYIFDSQLKLIPAGRRTHEPFYNLHLDNFQTFLEKIRHHLHLVFMDIPPLLEYAEGITLSKLCDGIILVIESSHTRVEDIQEAADLLQKANVPLLGSVMNKRKSYIPHWLNKYV